MKTREIVRVETIYFPSGAPQFRAVSCLLIVAVRGLPLQFYSETTASGYNRRGQIVWSRRVKFYKSIPPAWRQRDIDDASSASTASQEIIDNTSERPLRLFPHQYRIPSEYDHHFSPAPTASRGQRFSILSVKNAIRAIHTAIQIAHPLHSTTIIFLCHTTYTDIIPSIKCIRIITHTRLITHI
ncbi:hypothetical protein PWT90_00723 [Aphanocladium album]|nr:hypothetical protein PWT90_00723 [Aphanocladium album]